MGNVAKARTRRLKVAEVGSLPNTLGEYAGASNIDAGLREKLGKDTLWLFAKEVYGIFLAGETEADYLGLTEGIGIPVQYEGLRKLTLIEDTDEVDLQMVSFPTPQESVAIFHIDKGVEHVKELYLTSGNAISDYAEIAVRLGQTVTAFDFNDYKPEHSKMRWRKPQFRVVRDDDFDDTIEAENGI